MSITETTRHGTPRRALRYFGEAFWEGAVGVWKSLGFLIALGLAASCLAILGAGVVLAAALNVGWIFAAMFLVLFVITLIGGYRVWNTAERRAAEWEGNARELAAEATRRREHLPERVLDRVMSATEYAPAVHDRTFERCQFVGSVHLPGSDLRRCKWVLGRSRVIDSGDLPPGTCSFINCRFVDCEFNGCTAFGNAEQIGSLRPLFGPEFDS